MNPDGSGQPVAWHETPTETPHAGDTEVWEINNLTPEVHPVHLHATQFHILERQAIGGGPVRGPASWETGRKDTVLAYPGEVTRVRASFAQPGRFVWHCHIIEHEDNEMMRPIQVS
jgi:bilirubin oxidase